MKSSVKKVEKNKVCITIEVPKESVEDMLNEAAIALGKQVKIPGFRQGNIPRSVLEAKLGHEALSEHALEKELSNLYIQALEQIDYDPITSPSLSIVEDMRPGKKFIFEATVEVKPEVKLKNYKGIKVERPRTDVLAKDVNEALEKLRERFAELEEAEGKKIENGLFALIDYKGTIDGELYEGSSGSDYLFEVGSETFKGGFEEELIGMKKGEEKEIKVKLEKGLARDEVVGKTAVFKVKVKEIKEKALPELDDKFAEKAGQKTLKDLKKDIKENVKKVKEAQAEAHIRGELLEKVIGSIKIEIPEVVVESYSERLMKEFKSTLAQQGVSIEDYFKYTNQKMEDLKKEIDEEAVESAKTDLVLETIAKNEGLKASDAEIESRLKAVLDRLGEAQKQLTEGDDASRKLSLLRGSVRLELVKQKAVDFLVSNAKISLESKAEKKTKKETKAKPKKKAKPSPKSKTKTIIKKKKATKHTEEKKS